MQENSAPIKTEAPLPELDFLSWFSMDKKASIEAPSGNASPINPDDDFSAADLALASVPGLSFDPKSRCLSYQKITSIVLQIFVITNFCNLLLLHFEIFNEHVLVGQVFLQIL
jgi:hypothetical protein